MCKISVIVPVYNAETYVSQCLNSLLTQTFDDYEVIIIDDGSSDNSGEICDDFAARSSKIKVFHQDNSGPSKARQNGIMYSEGEYVAFVDSDDYVEENYLELLYKSLVNNDADLAECDYTTFSDSFCNRKYLYDKSYVKNETEFVNDIIKDTIINGTVAVVVWNKLYKRQIIDEYVKDFGKQPLEDYTFNMQYYRGVKRYCYVNEALINYRQVQGSLSKSFNSELYSILKCVNEQKKIFMKDMGLYSDSCITEANKWFVRYVYHYLKNTYAMKNKLSLREKNKLMLNILQDNYTYDICCDIAKNDTFAKLVSQKRFCYIHHHFAIDAFKIRTITALAGIKRKFKGRK